MPITLAFDPKEKRDPHTGQWTADPARVRSWQKQPTAKLRALLGRPNLHPQDRAEITAALVRKSSRAPAKPKGTSITKESTSDAWAEQHYGNWERGLSKEQKAVIRSYTSTDFCYRANRQLRAGRPSNAEDKAKIDALKKVINEAPPVPEDMQVYRSMSLPKSADINKIKGKTIIDGGFGSTSTLQKIAVSNFGGQPLAVIQVPKGSKAAFLSTRLNNKGFDEQELLLPPGAHYEVTNVTTRKEKPPSPALVLLHLKLVMQ